MKVIGISASGFPEPKSYAYHLCINCGYCVDICVFDALHHKVRKQRSSDPGAAIRRYEEMKKKRKSEQEIK